MTIVVTVKVTDGIVLAADSAASFFDGSGSPVKIYNNANKIFNLRKVWPLGALVYGNGGIGTASVETLSKDLRKRFVDGADQDYWLNPASYTVQEVAEKAKRFLFDECYHAAYPVPDPDYYMGYRVCGYSRNASLAECWEFTIHGSDCAGPTEIQPKDAFGIRWAGENEILDRVLFGVSSNVVGVLTDHGIAANEASDMYLEMAGKCGLKLTIPAMPIQDAIDVARFLVETASRFARFGLRPETIGGPTEIAAITKHEGFKWITRKHYYPAEFNLETTHGQ